MSAKREKEKERRRARKMAEEAWEAVEAGKLELAEKIIRRAVATQTDKPRRRQFPAGQGDTLLFCTRDRLRPIGGAYGLQPVKHGATEITAGERFVLGVPFHEYR
jgi:hypothetical protein